MEQAWNVGRNEIPKAMKAIVESSNVPVTKPIMVEMLEEKYRFPGRVGFTMSEFVDTICVRQDVLAEAGLVFEGGRVLGLEQWHDAQDEVCDSVYTGTSEETWYFVPYGHHPGVRERRGTVRCKVLGRRSVEEQGEQPDDSVLPGS
jgi:hypothetical protein